MKNKPWTESEFQILKNNLHLHIYEMIKKKILPGRTYWMIYNMLATNGYEYSYPKKKWVKIDKWR